jgi:hypothetical protein
MSKKSKTSKYIVFFSNSEFREATVQYNLDSATVSLDEVYFPSMVLCNMNTLRRSFIYSLIDDPMLKELNTTFPELQKIVHLIFIAGEDYVLNEREELLLEGKPDLAWSNLT